MGAKTLPQQSIDIERLRDTLGTVSLLSMRHRRRVGREGKLAHPRLPVVALSYRGGEARLLQEGNPRLSSEHRAIVRGGGGNDPCD